MADPLTPDSAVHLLLPAMAVGPALAAGPGSGQAGGRMLAALNLGHFGTKPQASDDNGATGTSCPRRPTRRSRSRRPAWPGNWA